VATLFAHIKIKPGCEAAFEEMARRLYAASHATETGLRRYEYWRGAEERLYYSLLSFDDYAGFLRHQASEHHETLTKDFRSWAESAHFEWVDPLPDASPLVPTRTQAPPADANDLMRAYAERMPAVVQPWWSHA
jgi:quinol monooxygenase YgiN